MSAIWKFPLFLTDEQEVEMPEGAELLHVDLQDGIVCVWARVDETRLREKRTICIRGTGHSIEKENGSQRYVGSAQMGSYVWHVFDWWA